MPKIISKRGKPEVQEVDIELDLSSLEDDTIAGIVSDDEPEQQVFEYYKEDWIIQSKFINRLHDLGCWTVYSVHEQTWKIFYRDTQVAMVTQYAIQSDMITVLDYVRDTIEVLNTISASIVQP